jgi:serine/threonine protein kinase
MKSPKQLSKEILKRKKFKLNGETDEGKHATVDFATRTPSSKYAIKNQIIQSPANIADKAYRELKILEELNKLKDNEAYYPNKDTNFISVIDWWKAKHDETKEPIMHYVLEYADLTLADIKKLSLYEYKCILFQVIFALYVAQKEFEFVHNDLHAKNILLKKHDKHDYLKLCEGDKTWYTSGYVVKITDFGLSRIKLSDSRVIYNKKRPDSELFSETIDIDSVFSVFNKIEITEDSWCTVEEIHKEKTKQKSSNSGNRKYEDDKEIKKIILKRKKGQLEEIRKMNEKSILKHRNAKYNIDLQRGLLLQKHNL